ncbi:MAG TPA: SUF system NifU family Fe-S cluster assembly protein [Chloroflexia bacterium]|nr:SUF system NifU family Fe-S cluster assembly protein [Chloroflexia bacterium]
MDSLYREVILEHYKQPHHQGQLADPTVSVEVDNPLCGDRLRIDLALQDGVVTDMAFTGRGCAISQAAASILSDDLIGRPVAEVATLTWRDMMELLGVEIGPARLKCALLGLRGVKMALAQAGVPITSYTDTDETE